MSRYILTVEDQSAAVLRVERESAGGVDELPVAEVLSRIHGPTGTGRDPGQLAKAPGALSRRPRRILPPPTVKAAEGSAAAAQEQAQSLITPST